MKKNYFAHCTAIVEKTANIGSGTKIWHFSHVMKAAKIGNNCTIGQNAFIGTGAIIGNNVKVQNNVSVYDSVELENDVFCGPSVVFTNVFNPRSRIERKDEYRRTIVKQGASLGANATIVCGNVIGEFAFVGAGAVVTSDVPDYALVYGNPSRLHGWMCRCGIKLNFNLMKNKSIARCEGCKMIFEKENNTVRRVKQKRNCDLA